MKLIDDFKKYLKEHKFTLIITLILFLLGIYWYQIPNLIINFFINISSIFSDYFYSKFSSDLNYSSLHIILLLIFIICYYLFFIFPMGVFHKINHNIDIISQILNNFNENIIGNKDIDKSKSNSINNTYSFIDWDSISLFLDKILSFKFYYITIIKDFKFTSIVYIGLIIFFYFDMMINNTVNSLRDDFNKKINIISLYSSDYEIKKIKYLCVKIQSKYDYNRLMNQFDSLYKKYNIRD